MSHKITSSFKNQQGGGIHSKIIKKLKSFLSYSLKLFILTSFLISQSFIAEIFLYQNHPDTKSINTAQADYNDHWYNTNWSYRKPITINHTNIPHTDTNNPNAYLSNFPVLVSTNIPTDKARSDHNDIVFASCDVSACSVLSYEIESYDTTNGNLTAWVKVPQLNDVNNTIDTSFYMYYGNYSHSIGDLENKTAVWDDGGGAGGNHFKMVQHLGGNIANGVAGHLDSTQYANNGTPNNFNP